MTPNGGGEPTGELADAINSDFGSLRRRSTSSSPRPRPRSSAPAGPGWSTDDGKLEITKTANADLPMKHGSQGRCSPSTSGSTPTTSTTATPGPNYIETFLEHLVNWDFARRTWPAEPHRALRSRRGSGSLSDPGPRRLAVRATATSRHPPPPAAVTDPPRPRLLDPQHRLLLVGMIYLETARRRDRVDGDRHRHARRRGGPGRSLALRLGLQLVLSGDARRGGRRRPGGRPGAPRRTDGVGHRGLRRRSRDRWLRPVDVGPRGRASCQGLGAGVVPTVAYVYVGRGFPAELRPRVFAVMSTAWVVPSFVSPLFTSEVADRVGWRWVFLGLIPVTVVVGLRAVPALRSGRDPEVGRLGRPSAPRTPLGAVARVSRGTAVVLAGLQHANGPGSVCSVAVRAGCVPCPGVPCD